MNGVDASYQERYLTAQDGLRLYYRDYGPHGSRAAPLLCLTGLTRNSKDFHRLASTYSARRRVLCLDYRGRGRSDYDPDWRNYAIPTYVTDVRHLLAANDIHGVVIVGTSLGGMVAMVIAAAFPAVLRGVVLNDIGPEVEAAGMARILAYIRNLRPLPDWPTAARELKRCFPRLSLQTDEEWLTFARATLREGSDGLLYPDWDMNLLKPFRGAAPVSLWNLFQALSRVPLMAVRGGISDVFRPETLAKMAAARPDMVQVTVPNVGHVPTLREPEVTPALEAFLARL
ncbi:MAG: alpha/beta hydrolase [Alphaproteobacteria bacterium]